MRGLRSEAPGIAKPSNVVPSRRHFAITAGLYAMLAIYGSFVPFDFHAHPFNQAWRFYRHEIATPVAVHSISDWGANILLFFPLAFLWMAAICVDRRASFGWLAAPSVLAGALLLSSLIEFGQVFVPYRVVSPNDVVAETFGAAGGIAVWLVSGNRITSFARQVLALNPFKGTLGALALMYGLALFLIQLMPLDLTLSPALVYRKYRRGQIHLLPFTDPDSSWLASAGHLAEILICFAPAGVLLALAGAAGIRTKLGFTHALLFAVFLSIAIEVAQVLVVGRHVVVADIPLAAGVVFIGWWLTTRALAAHRGPLFDSAASVRRLSQAAIGLWILFLMVVNWQPFDFDLETQRLFTRIGEINLVPFADYEAQANLDLASELAEKGASFFVLGGLLAATVARPRDRLRRVLLYAGLIALTIEAGQLLLPARHPSITDLLIETAAAVVGSALINRLIGNAAEPKTQPDAGRFLDRSAADSPVCCNR